ncbi:MAG: thiamine-phosphate kinase [Bacteroidota bacterium]
MEKTKNLKSVGEFGLIEEYIAPEFKDLVKEHMTGIGDDCSIIPISKTTSHIFTTDMLIEKTHFLRDKITPYQLGFKSLAVNLSDIAAMGGNPVGSYISVGLPKDIELSWIEEFMKGYKDLSEKEDVPLLGGDTTSSENSIVINIGVTGEIANQNIKTRSSAKTGDIVCLTGETGESAAGLQALFLDLPEDNNTKPLLEKHLSPYPHVSEGKWLAKHDEVNAMIDVSDGISSDLMHILKASSRKGIVVLEKIPMTNFLLNFCNTHQINPIELALSGGEDYVLLLTIKGEAFENIAKSFMDEFQKPLYPIGKIEDGKPEIAYFKDDKQVENIRKGYSHF